MKQLSYSINDELAIRQMASEVADLPEYERATGRLLIVQEPAGNPELAQTNAALLGKLLPKTHVISVSMINLPGNTVMPKVGTVCTLLLFSSATLDVKAYDCSKMNVREAGREFAASIKAQADAKGVLCFTSCVTVSPAPFVEEVSLDYPELPIFGTQASTVRLADDQSLIVVDGVAYGHGVVAIVLCGEDLHILTDYNLGWRAVGRDFTVTEYEGNGRVSAIDENPAVSIYRKYLNVSSDSNFRDTICTFPLVEKNRDLLAARVPFGFTEDGTLQFSIALPRGTRLRFAYSKPEYLMRTSIASANRIARFDPQALLLFACWNRRMLLGDERADREFDYYRRVCPSAIWAHGHCEILATSEGGGVLNNSIVAVAIREGEQSGCEPTLVSDPEFESRAASMSLADRLVTFLEATTEELRSTIDELETLAERDTLTGVYNRRRMNELLRYELSKRRAESNLVLLMYDIDHFKRVNDTFGHDTGDMVLKSLTDCVQGMVRSADTLSRWGGEEFLCLLTHTNIEQARIVAERIRKNVEQTSFGQVGRVTISIGITAALSTDTPDTLFARADKALYAAKHAGRNCTREA